METIAYVLRFVVGAVISLAPFFFLSIALAALVKTLRLETRLKSSLNQRQIASVPLAAGTGAFSPLCSCGVIPTIAALLAAGIPLAPIMTFWITSPLMSPESFVMTYRILGKEMAIARLLTTLSIGLIAGYVTLFLSQRGWIGQEMVRFQDGTDTPSEHTGDPVDALSRKERLILQSIRFFLHMKDMTLFIGKYILIAFVLEALITRYVPMDRVAGLLGKDNAAGPLLAALIGIPAYASSISAMPVVRGLMDLGMDKGTALSFMIGGAATSIPAMTAVYAIVRRRIFFLYLLFSLLGAVGAGYLFRLL